MATATLKQYDTKSQASRAVRDAFAKLNPKGQVKNPVMFMVFVSAILTTIPVSYTHLDVYKRQVSRSSSSVSPLGRSSSPARAASGTMAYLSLIHI